MRLVEGDLRVSTPGQNVARKRVWGDFFTAGSRGIRTSNDLLRKGGAAARMMLVQAAAEQWKVPAAECRSRTGVITHKASNRSTTYGKVAEAAGKIEPPQEIKLKDRRTGRSSARASNGSTPPKVDGKTQYGIDVRRPGMLYAAIKACPVNGGKVKSFDAAKISGGKGVKKVVPVEDYAVAVIADSWWRAKTALDALPIAWDEGENAKVSSAVDCRLAEGRSRRRSGVRRQQRRRRKSRVGRCRQEGRGRLRLSLSEPRHAGAAERDCALHRRQVRGLDSMPERRAGAGNRIGGLRTADPQMRGLQDLPRRRIRPALDVAGLHPPGGAHRQGRCRARRSSSYGRAKRT